MSRVRHSESLLHHVQHFVESSPIEGEHVLAVRERGEGTRSIVVSSVVACQIECVLLSSSCHYITTSDIEI